MDMGKKLDPQNLGVSLVTANSPKGKEVLMNIKSVFMLYPLESERAIAGNRWLSHGIERNELRAKFFEVFEREGFTATQDIIFFFK